MAAKYDILATPPKALTFDVFGTTVNWRETITNTLRLSAGTKFSETGKPLSTEVGELNNQNWEQLAQEWRDSYKAFVKGFVPGQSEWRDIDTHHHLSLIDLLEKYGLAGLYTDEEVRGLSLTWHYLEPWSDSSSGLRLLNQKFITSTLSNGNPSLLKDLNEHGNLGFAKLQSGADFKAYKPHPSVYKGAAAAMGLEPGEVAMVTAHLNDLKAARACGFRTIYVERPREEDWSPEQEEYQEAKGWVDMWVGEGENGFIGVAERFGLKGE